MSEHIVITRTDYDYSMIFKKADIVWVMPCNIEGIGACVFLKGADCAVDVLETYDYFLNELDCMEQAKSPLRLERSES